MNPEGEQSFIYNILNDPTTFPQEVPIKEIIGKLGLMWTRNYALDHPSTPLLFDYDQMVSQLIVAKIGPLSKLSSC